MIGKLFQAHGEFCASHPMEVILALLALVLCMLTMEKGSGGQGEATSTFARFFTTTGSSQHNSGGGMNNRYCRTDTCDGFEQEYNAADVILMTIVRCFAVLYCYYQFRTIHRFGSKSILGIAAIFTIFSTFIFTSSIVNFMGSEISDLKDALFFFLLLIDLPKAGMLAQLALSGASETEVINNIAKGMSVLGPVLSLDTVVEALVIGVGTLSGVHRLELLCGYAVMSVVVNYIVFMTFYPACLALYLDLTRSNTSAACVPPSRQSMLLSLLVEEEQKPNPVVQRVKLIMSTGLMIVHIHSRFTFSEDESAEVESVVMKVQDHLVLNNTESNNLSDYIMRLLEISTEQIVILILLVALLIVKFIFFESREDLARLSANMQEAPPAIESSSQTEPEPPRVVFTLDDDPVLQNQSVQTDNVTEFEKLEVPYHPPKPVEECFALLQSGSIKAKELSDEEIVQIVESGRREYRLQSIEKIVDDNERGVKIRRQVIGQKVNVPQQIIDKIPYKNYDYDKVMNACCENVLGYVPVPIGYAGPLLLDGMKYFVPMATTEGALIASASRGCKALSVRGVTSTVEDVGMTRAPCVKFPGIIRATECKRWIETEENYLMIKKVFDSTSRYARLQEIFVGIDGEHLYPRFRALTGDAMGMNMVSKGAEKALTKIKEKFPDMEVISLSGNFCSDKKPAAINMIKGRGKRVICQSIVPEEALRSIFHTTAETLVYSNIAKNHYGSSLAGSIGGNNAHAANTVTAIFIATGQDPAQNVTSSNCSTCMEVSGKDLKITCTMHSLEVGTVGGGTVLPAQSASLDVLGVRGAHQTQPGSNSRQLARIIGATVMASELSLMAALVNNELVSSHMRHNRSSVAVNPGITPLPANHPLFQLQSTTTNSLPSKALS